LVRFYLINWAGKKAGDNNEAFDRRRKNKQHRKGTYCAGTVHIILLPYTFCCCALDSWRVFWIKLYDLFPSLMIPWYLDHTELTTLDVPCLHVGIKKKKDLVDFPPTWCLGDEKLINKKEGPLPLRWRVVCESEKNTMMNDVLAPPYNRSFPTLPRANLPKAWAWLPLSLYIYISLFAPLPRHPNPTVNLHFYTIPIQQNSIAKIYFLI